MKYKIILDRSIFHKTNYEKLEKSKLVESVKQNKICLYFTTVFWEETLRFEKTDRARLKEQLLYLEKVDTNKWFKDIKEIISLELDGKWCEHDYHLFGNSDVKQRRSRMLLLSEGNIDTNDAWGEYSKIDEKKRVLMEVRRSERLKQGVIKCSFNEFVAGNRISFIRNHILPNHLNLNSNWEYNLNKCKMTNSYANACLSIQYLTYGFDSKIDKNDKMDAEQLAFLCFADIIVSNDTKYMLNAFNLLYKDTDKKYFNLDEFMKYVGKL